MRNLGSMEFESGWSHVVNHIPETDNVLADGVSRWSEAKMYDNVRRLTKDENWMQQDIQYRDTSILELVLQPKMPNKEWTT